MIATAQLSVSNSGMNLSSGSSRLSAEALKRARARVYPSTNHSQLAEEAMSPSFTGTEVRTPSRPGGRVTSRTRRTSAKGREAQRRWRKQNPEKVSEYKRAWYYERGGRETESIRTADASIARLREQLAEWEAATPEERRALLGVRAS
jgi:hypothetical protein